MTPEEQEDIIEWDRPLAPTPRTTGTGLLGASPPKERNGM